jgi:protein tyrosine/serine phosphatase
MVITRWAVLALLLLLPGWAFARDANWALPLTLEGVPNLNQVAPNLYRSAQPTAAGFQAAEKALKLQTVLDLRNFHSDVDLVSGTQIRVVALRMNAWHITQEEVISALKIIRDAQANGPVLVHCQHGADRTGVLIAMYRILYQGWNKAQALDEMEHGGFNFHSIFANIPDFVQNADLAAYKRALAINP